MNPDPKVRDFTAGRGDFTVQVGMHPAHDLLLALWALDGCYDDGESRNSFDLGPDWFARFQDGLSADTGRLLERIGEGEVWLGLVPIAAEIDAGNSISEFLDYLAAYDPVELRFQLLDHWPSSSAEQRALKHAAAEGDADSITGFLSDPMFDKEKHKRWRDSLQLLLEMDPEETRDLIVAALRNTQEEVFAKYEEEFLPALQRDYQAKQAMASRLPPDRLIELATNGITVEHMSDRRPVMLVPSVVSRPWVVITASPDMRLLCYPVAEEYLDADPDAPPQWLVATYKALGDEKRLRILRLLAKGPTSLQQIAEELDVAKSTAHHHMGLLRAAGLVRVTLGDDKVFSLREDTMPETAAVLAGYLSTNSTTTEEERR